MLNKKIKDLTGLKFNKLTIISFSHMDKYHNAHWNCICECGNSITTLGYSVTTNHTKSCGCLFAPIKRKKHGLSKTRIYQTWADMKDRCYNVKSRVYNDYGGRNIIVFDLWKKDFMSFYEWAIDNGYNDNLTIDRIDVDGNYDPNNCRFITNLQQQYNKRTSKFLEYNGKKQTIREWEKEYNLNPSVLRFRLNKGWDIERALTQPVNSLKRKAAK